MNQTTKEQGKQVREEILKSIIEYIKKYGYPPTVREIGDMTGLKSTSSVKNHLDRMVKAGLLETDHECSPRAIRVPEYRFVREDLERSESKGKPEPVQYCYSWDGENYSNGLFATKEEAVQDAKETKRLYGYREKEIYVARAVKPDLSWNSNEECILESVLEHLKEECGEYGEDGLEVTDDQEVALGRMIDKAVSEWISRYKIKPTCYAAECPELWEV